MCRIWDWQSTIVKDLNDSQDPKHTLFWRKNAFVAICALFSDNKCALFARLGGWGVGVAERAQCDLLFAVFFYFGASLRFSSKWRQHILHEYNLENSDNFFH